MNPLNTYFRVYPNDDRSAVLHLTDEETKAVEAYNRRYRPGCAQYVNGKCVYRGYLSVEEARVIDPTMTDTVDGVTVAQAQQILRSETEIEMPTKETLPGFQKPSVRAILGR